MNITKKFLYVALFSIFFVSASTICAKPNTTNFINIPWELDGRDWRVSETFNHTTYGIVRFSPENQNIESWTDLVTLQWYEGERTTAGKYFEDFVAGLRRMWPEAQLSAEVIESTNLSLFGEWKMSTRDEVAMYGLIKVFAVNEDLYLLTYTSKNANKANQSNQTWNKILKQAKLNYKDIERFTY